MDFQVLSAGRILGHGEALSLLQRQEESEFFAYMDSDIFAMGPFLGPLREALGGWDAVFSCKPFWSVPIFEEFKPHYRLLGGCYQRFSNGVCLGNSYLGIYDNRTLRNAIERSGVDFRIRLISEIRAPLRRRLRERGVRVRYFDTGRLLNVVLSLEGARTTYLDSPNLKHFGGISSIPEWRHLQDTTAVRAFVKKCLPSPIMSLVRGLRGRPGGWLLPEEERLNRLKDERRMPVSDFFYRLLSALDESRPFSMRFRHPDPALVEEVEALAEDIRDICRPSGGVSGGATLSGSAR